MFSQGWGLKEAEKTTPRIHKKIAHFFPGSWFHLSGEEALSLLSAGSKSATLSPPLRQKESGKKILNSDNAFTGRLLNSSFLAADLTAL